MAQKDLTITLDQYGLVNLGPSEMPVKRGDIVKWTSSRPFALHFGGRTPFLPTSTNDGKGGAVSIKSSSNMAQRTVATDVPLGSYRYVVAVCGDPDVEISVHSSLRVEC